MILKRILFLFTSVALLAGCSSGRAPEIRAICLRDDIGNYIIKWETDPHTDGTMKLYVSDTPNSFDMSRPCSYADINDGRVTYITNDNITRKYFLLSFNDKYYRTVGARSVQMDSVQNLRDIGGYFSEHGNRMTGWGKIFRSGELKALSRNDTIRLDNLKIKTVIDLRGEDEIALAPEKYAGANIISIPIPVKGKEQITRRLEEGRIRKGDGLVYLYQLCDGQQRTIRQSPESLSRQGQLPDPRELLDGKRPCRLPDGHAADSPRCAGRNDHERLYGFQQPHRPAQPCLYGTQPQYGRPGNHHRAARCKRDMAGSGLP